MIFVLLADFYPNFIDLFGSVSIADFDAFVADFKLFLDNRGTVLFLHS